ncbi:MAG TPA: hypothetical protein VJ744_02050 [Gaiellaceae bacterium]|nr:hypothetical protein [Gaiellaceae bacterium]
MAPSRASRKRPGPSRLRLVGGLALLLVALGVSACAEVPSNLVENNPYELEPIEGTDIQRVKLSDETAARIDLQTATVGTAGRRTAVPHMALIYNPDGEVFVYTRPEPQTYVRAPVTVRRVEGEQALLSDGPPAGTVVVTVGAAELLATEYEILNQHP